MYTVNVEPGVDTDDAGSSSGQAILQDLRESERKLAVLLELLAAVESKTECHPSVLPGPQDLSALVQKCRDHDIEVHPAIVAWLVTRELETMEVESEEFRSCLDPKVSVLPSLATASRSWPVI